MSDDSFYGRPIGKGFTSLEFNLCEICQKHPPNWIEAKFEGDKPVLRVTCDQCHQESLDNESKVSPEFYSREMEEDEEIPEAVRPAWMEDLIEEQKEKGSIETIGTREEISENKEEGGFSSAPDSFQQSISEEQNIVDQSERQVAVWAPRFIQEALFGPNPQKWLEEQGGFEPNTLDNTIKTLGSFVNHDMPSVKLSAIQCLSSIPSKAPDKKTKVEDTLNRYVNDDDETVSDFAKQTLDQF